MLRSPHLWQYLSKEDNDKSDDQYLDQQVHVQINNEMDSANMQQRSKQKIRKYYNADIKDPASNKQWSIDCFSLIE